MKRAQLLVFHLDDEISFLEAVKNSLQKTSQLDRSYLVESFKTSKELLNRANSAPDILLLDYSLSHKLEQSLINGLDVSNLSAKLWPNAVQILLTSSEDRIVLQNSLSNISFIHDFLPKNTALTSLPSLLDTIYRIALVKYGLTYKLPTNQAKTSLPAIAGQTLPTLAKDLSPLIAGSCSLLIHGEPGSGKGALLSCLLCNLPKNAIVNYVNSLEVSSTEAKVIFKKHLSPNLKNVVDQFLVIREAQDLPRHGRKALLELLDEFSLNARQSIKLRLLVTYSNQHSTNSLTDNFINELSKRVTLPIFIPPLRERTDEINDLIQFWIEREYPCKPPIFSKPTIECLNSYKWDRENVAELFKTLKSMTNLQGGKLITPIALPKHMRFQKSLPSIFQTDSDPKENSFSIDFDPLFEKGFDRYVYELLSKLIKLTAAQCRILGREPSTRGLAKLLQISRPTLIRHLKTLETLNLINKEESRELMYRS